MGELKLGDEVRDTITGFRGVLVSITEWLHGCKRGMVQCRELCEGKPVECQAFDLAQLEWVNKTAIAPTESNAGPRPNPPHRPESTRR